MAEALFPPLPEDISAVSDEDLQTLKADYESAKTLIAEENEEFLKDLSAEEILSELEKGKSAYHVLLAESDLRARAHENYTEKKGDILKGFEPVEEEPEETVEEETLEVVAEGDEPSDPAPDDDGGEDSEKAVEEERELVLASAEVEVKSEPQVRFARKAPATAPSREVPVEPATTGVSLVAAGEMSSQFQGPLDSVKLGELVKASAMHYGPAPKTQAPNAAGRFGGYEHKIAHATYEFPADRTLGDNDQENHDKIAAVIPAYMPGGVGNLSGEALVASGGLCAPAEPFYNLVNFGTTDEPVWDALPIFAARRGAVNIPESHYIADIVTSGAGAAITTVTESNDALGGTFATKTCQDLDCYTYTETAIQIIAHCRTYGNLNARSWPELIAHENELTMQGLARVSETYLLNQLKALSINVTNGADTLGALVYIVDAIVKARFGIIGRFRMPRTARFRAYLPYWFPSMLVLDNVQTPYDRFRSEGQLVDYLRSNGIDPVFYLDSPTTGTTQLPDASQTATTIDGLPANVQWAIHPEGAFLGIDMGVLELGIVRDSVLNETNDFQVFGERFRNIARVAPAQSAWWVTSNVCPTGQFPPAGTARTCE